MHSSTRIYTILSVVTVTLPSEVNSKL